MNDFISGALIGGGIATVVMSIFALKMNKKWFEHCEKQNDDWYEHCEKMNHDWGEYVRKNYIDNKEEEKDSDER